jgi:DNA-binding NarL/FixJ family response regulator
MTIAASAIVIVLLLTKSNISDLNSSAQTDVLNQMPEDTPPPPPFIPPLGGGGGDPFIFFCTTHGLSKMESEVIHLYSQGRSVRSISSKLFISESTTRTYIQRVYTKLNIHNRQKLLDLLDEAEKSVE